MTRALLALALLCCALFSVTAQSAKGKKYALLVGVTKYDHPSLSALKFPENDVEALAEVLGSKQGGYEVRVLSITRGKNDAKDHPTAKNVEAAIDALLEGKTSDDLVLIAFSGHGVQMEVDDPVTDKKKRPTRTYRYFCPIDTELKDISYSTGKAPKLVNVEDVLRRMGNKCKAGTKLLLVDACRNSVKAESIRRSFDPQKLTIPEGVGAMFSCRSGEFSFETEKLPKKGSKDGHGVFFYHLLEALRGEAANEKGEVRWSRLVEYTTDEVIEKVPRLIGDGAKQTPHSADNFVGSPPVLCLTTSSGTKKIEPKKSIGKSPAPTISADAEKAYEKGKALFFGTKTTTIHQAEAIKLLIEAAKKDHPIACAMLARAYWRGEGVPSSSKESKAWEEKAGNLKVAKLAAEGNADALVEVAQSRYNLSKTQFEFADRAAAQGNLAGITLLGDCYHHGIGTAKDFPKAEELYRKAVAAGFAQAQFKLSLYLKLAATAEGKDAATKEARQKEAITLLLAAAAQNHPSAMNQLAFAHFNGRDVQKDANKAISLLEKSAEQQSLIAALNLGGRYYQGDGVPQNDEKAFKYFRQAAAHDRATFAIDRFATMVLEGRGYAKSERSAMVKEAIERMKASMPSERTPDPKRKATLEKLEALEKK